MYIYRAKLNHPDTRPIYTPTWSEYLKANSGNILKKLAQQDFENKHQYFLWSFPILV